MVSRVLVVALPSSKLERIAQRLEREGALVTRAEAAEDLWKHLASESFDLVLLRRDDVPAFSTNIVSEIRALPDGPDVVVVAAKEDPEERAELLTAGCVAVVYEGLGEATLVRTIEALLQRRLEQTERNLDKSGIQPFRLSDYASASPAMRQFLDTARRVVATDTTLLLLGETGVGKEWLARAIHAEGPRAAAPFVAVNCGALPETLLESELFGHTKGRLHRRHPRPPRLLRAGPRRNDLPRRDRRSSRQHLQVKLLRVLEERRIQPIGSERADCRGRAGPGRDQPRPRGEVREDASARTSSTGWTWSRSPSLRCANGARTSPSCCGATSTTSASGCSEVIGGASRGARALTATTGRETSAN